MASVGWVFLAGAASAGLVFEKKDIQAEMSPLQSECVARYAFRNSGSGKVRITGLRATCPCTTPEIKKVSYAPDEAGEIVVRFEPGHRHGVQRQGVVVKTDDPEQPHVVLSLTANIPKVITLSGDVLLWKEGEPPESKTLIVTAAPGIDVREVRALAGSSRLRVATRRTGESTFAVEVTPSARARNLSEVLHVEAILDGGQMKRSSVYVRVR